MPMLQNLQHHEPIEKPVVSFAALFALGCSVLIFEVALTRVFSFTLWYHMTYLVVGLVMLGFGAAGTALAIANNFDSTRYSRIIAENCGLFSLFAIIATVVGIQLPTNTDTLFEGHKGQLFVMLLTHILLAIPFFFAGKAIGFVLMHNRKHTSALYSSDLLGAGLGALLAVVLINRVGAITAIFLAAALPSFVALYAAVKESLWLKTSLACLSVLLTACSVLSTSFNLIPLTISPSKDLTTTRHIIFSEWNILNRIDMMETSYGEFDFGGRISPSFRGQFPPIHVIYQDATAPTALVNVTGDPKSVELLGDFLQGAPYSIRKQPASVLILGFGGGIDGLIAEHAGAARITGVDINPVTAGLVTRQYRDFDPGLFAGQNLNVVVSEGRNYLTRTHDKFDVIQLSGVDTFAALSAGAFSLSESYLYTSEAVDDLYSRLSDDGVLSYSRWLFNPPRETLRLTVTINNALHRANVRDPRSHIVIVAGGPPLSRWADTIVKKSPFTENEVNDIREWAQQRQFGIVYSPFHPLDNYFNQYLNGTDQQQKAFVQNYLYDVSPSTDDKPFFFQFYRWRDVWSPDSVAGLGGYVTGRTPKGLLSLLIALIEMTILSIVFVLLPLSKRRTSGIPLRDCLSWISIFAGLGLGFIAVEMVLMQKLSVFVGGPAYSMAITLSALLIFSGIGSALSQNIWKGGRRSIGIALIAVLAIQGLELLFLDFGVPVLLGLGQVSRFAIAVAAIAPLGTAMGMPFPSLLARAGVASETLVPWAWGVNACATVVGSVLSTIASMTLGFNLTWSLAMGCYAAVLLLVLFGVGGYAEAESRSEDDFAFRREEEPSLVG